jgi:RNA polymerase sigma-70 factor (ECF subfamily)
VDRRTEPRLDDAGNFDDFFDREYRSLLRLAFAMTGSPVEAEDLAQEAMARALERWPRVRGMSSPAGYVYRIALNLNRSRLRRLRRRSERPLDAPRPPHADPEIVGSLMGTLLALPRGQREALLLVEWLGFDAGEAGKILGISPSSVRSRIHRAKSALRIEGGDVDDD